MVPMRQRLTGLPGGSSKWGVRASWLAVCCAALSLSAQSGAALFGFQWPGLWVASLPSSAIILILLACSIAYRDAVGATDGIARLPVIVAVALLLVRVALELPLTATAHGIGAVLLPEPFATAVAMLAELGRKPTLCLLAIALAELLLRVGRPILSQFAAFAALAICANAAIYLADNMPLQYAFMVRPPRSPPPACRRRAARQHRPRLDAGADGGHAGQPFRAVFAERLHSRDFPDMLLFSHKTRMSRTARCWPMRRGRCWR